MRNPFLPLLVLALAAACSDAPAEAAAATGAKTAAATAPAPAAPAPAPEKQAVAKIVFVDKEHACECTQAAIDKTLAALNAVLAGRPLPVERLHFDTQREQVASYLKLKPMVTVPALYLLDAGGGLVDVVQGESDEAKLRTHLH